MITQSKNQVFENKDIYFEGTFAVITLSNDDKLKSIYIGEGKKLNYKNETIETDVSNSYFKNYSVKGTKI